MVINRVGPLSCAKIAAVVYAIMGLIFGGIFSLVAMGGAFAAADSGNAMFPMIFGAGAIFVLPIFYGCMGFVGTLIMAWLYNLVAGMLGGVELEVQ
jgi:hypothetical protein